MAHVCGCQITVHTGPQYVEIAITSPAIKAPHPMNEDSSHMCVCVRKFQYMRALVVNFSTSARVLP